MTKSNLVLVVVACFGSFDAFARGIGGGGHGGSWTPFFVILIMVGAVLAWKGFIHALGFIWVWLIRLGIMK